MPKKTDVVRRSLFGSGGVEEQGTDQRKPNHSANRSRARTSGSRTTEPERVEPAAARASRRALERTAITVPSDLLMRVKDAVAVLNGWAQQYTMTRFVEVAFAAQLERLKVEHNGGREFPVTNRRIRTGRPPGT